MNEISRWSNKSKHWTIVDPNDPEIFLKQVESFPKVMHKNVCKLRFNNNFRVENNFQINWPPFPSINYLKKQQLLKMI